MSDFDNSLIDTDNLPDWVLGGIDSVKSVFSSFFDGNFFSGDGVYPAVVISKAVNISPSEYTALGFPNYDSASNRVYKKFKVRIINKRNNPHAMLENPCDLSTATELCQQNSLIASHTTVATHGAAGVGIGALVEIKLDKLPNNTYNLQTAHLVSVLQHNDTGQQILNKEACDSMSLMFEHGESYTPPPEIVVNSDLFEWADKYDAEPVPNKRQHASFLRDIEGRKRMFEVYVKTFFYLVWKRLGYSITITDGVRSQSEQTRLYNAWVARGRTGLPAAKLVGYHNGLAIDMNFNTEGVEVNGVTGTIGSSKLMNQDDAANKALWLKSGIVDIATEVGLTWGGNFKPNQYDPIHFQWNPAGWTLDDVRMHGSNSAAPPISTEAGSGKVGATEVGKDHEESQDTLEQTFENVAGTSPTIDEDGTRIYMPWEESDPALDHSGDDYPADN